jgi:hypothetical protein
MIFAVLGVIIVMVLMYLAIVRLAPAPAQISQPDTAYDSQTEIFRDLQPSSQVRDNAWVGFLQEDVRTGRTGPIGDFKGNESSNVRMYVYSF